MASTCANSAGESAVRASSSTPETITSGSTPAPRSVRSRAGEAEASTKRTVTAPDCQREWRNC